MKTSVFFQILTILVFANQNIFAQQSTKTLVQSFEIKDISEVTIDIPNVTVEVKEWNNLSEMRIHMEVSANMPETTFKSIVMAGRYNIVNTKFKSNYIDYACLEKTSCIIWQRVERKNFIFSICAFKNKS